MPLYEISRLFDPYTGERSQIQFFHDFRDGMGSYRPTQHVWVTLQRPAHLSEYLKRAR